MNNLTAIKAAERTRRVKGGEWVSGRLYSNRGQNDSVGKSIFFHLKAFCRWINLCAPRSAILFSLALLSTACEKTSSIFFLPLANNSQWLRRSLGEKRVKAFDSRGDGQDAKPSCLSSQLSWKSIPPLWTYWTNLTFLIYSEFLLENSKIDHARCCSWVLLIFFTRQNGKSIQTDQGEMVREETFLLIKARQKHPKDNLCLCPWKLRSCKSKKWRLWLSVGTSECLKQVQSELLWFRFELLFLYQHIGPTLICRVLTFSGDFFVDSRQSSTSPFQLALHPHTPRKYE